MIFCKRSEICKSISLSSPFSFSAARRGGRGPRCCAETETCDDQRLVMEIKNWSAREIQKGLQTVDHQEMNLSNFSQHVTERVEPQRLNKAAVYRGEEG